MATTFVDHIQMEFKAAMAIAKMRRQRHMVDDVGMAMTRTIPTTTTTMSPAEDVSNGDFHS